eukprot:TRINITY_DN9835_c0_g1_i1.p1 TRINITY_DN9835_c0_g1~~TRINITY_DN9835_c0_g1_i1.p1  ORF type:complete len:716 (-),score=112.35 TRINITY_DN9835_c0_g1_i1:36-2183(-)
MQSAVIQPEVLDRKIKVLTLPSPLSDVNTVRVVHQHIEELIAQIDDHLKSDQIDSGTRRLIQRRRLALEKEKVRCAEFLDEKGYLIGGPSQSLQDDVDRIIETKKGLHTKLVLLDRECKALFGPGRGSVSAGSGVALSPGASPPTPTYPGVPVGPTLLKLGGASSSSTQTAPDTKLDDKTANGAQTSSLLYQRAHRLLLKYEHTLKTMQKLTLATATGPAATALDAVHKEIRQEMVHIISIMRRILGSPIPTPGPRLPRHECPACFARGDYYCPDCSKRLQKHYEKIALKKCGNILLQQRNQELARNLEEGPLNQYQEHVAKQMETSMKRAQLEEMQRKIEEVKASIARKQALVQQQLEETRQLEESNAIFEKHLEQRRETIRELERAAKAAAESRAKKEEELAALRRDKVKHLLSIMPVRPDPTRPGKTILLNTSLRDDGIFETTVPTTREDPEITAVSLGNLVRLLMILGKYLNVTYPFQMRFNGSQSVIWLDGSETRYILHETRAPSRDNYKIALKRLRLNVYCLCFSQGLIIRGQHPEQNMLKNLQYLIQHSELLGWERPQFMEINPSMAKIKVVKSPQPLDRSLSSSSLASTGGISSTILSASDVRHTALAAETSGNTTALIDSNVIATEQKSSDDLDEFVTVEFTAPHPDDPTELQHFMKAHADHSTDSPIVASSSSGSGTGSVGGAGAAQPGSPNRPEEEDEIVAYDL